MTHPDYFKEIKATDTQVGGDHYKLPIQPTDYIYENNLNWYQGNVIKYISRYNRKSSDTAKQIEDLKKAIHYIQLLIEKIDNTKK